MVLVASLSFILSGRIGDVGEYGKGSECIVLQDGKPLSRLNLEKDGRISILDGRMVLEIADGRLRVIQANCPRQICVHSGWVNQPGQIIACVPNRILIKIESSDDPFIDAVVQ